MRPLTPLAIVTVAAPLLASCIGGPGNAGVAWLRNESADTVSIVIEDKSHAGLSGIIGGTDSITVNLPPWQSGWCYGDGRGINAGAVTIKVSGSSVPVPISSTFTETADAPHDVTVVVDATGEVHLSRETPSDKTPCSGYPEVAPSPSP